MAYETLSAAVYLLVHVCPAGHSHAPSHACGKDGPSMPPIWHVVAQNDSPMSIGFIVLRQQTCAGGQFRELRQRTIVPEPWLICV
jgi:hypothetical protein